jgi:hypothetical protein
MPFHRTTARQPWQRKRPKWAVVLPLYDGRECPYCFAIVCGTAAKFAHDRWHHEQGDIQRMLTEALEKLAGHAQLTVRKRDPDGGPELGEGLDDDDRLTVKARTVLGNYDSEEED